MGKLCSGELLFIRRRWGSPSAFGFLQGEKEIYITMEEESREGPGRDEHFWFFP